MNIYFDKGLDLKLEGGVEDSSIDFRPPKVCAVTPDDYPGFVPKPDVQPGDKVLVGSSLLHNKLCPKMRLVSPVSGTVKDIVRGERRKILRVEVENDGRLEKINFDTSANDVLDLLSEAGLLACFRARPFDRIVDPEVKPVNIFVNGLDTAPLAAGQHTSLLDHFSKEQMQLAGKIVSQLCSGRVYITVPPETDLPEIDDCEIVRVHGPHPAGVVGFQIAKIAPIDKGETVWTTDLNTFLRIGALFDSKSVDFTARVAVTGPAVERPYVAGTVEGCDVATLTEGCLKADDRKKRIISGNVLSGTAVGRDGFMRRPDTQLTVIFEGDDVVEFMGWASVSPKKMSVWNALPFRKLRKSFSPDARLNGGRRAIIMSGEYQRAFPADIIPEYLIKAIISRNIDDMEGLGIYEVAPEDFALCEYLDSSKMPLQQIVRDGLDFLYKELH